MGYTGGLCSYCGNPFPTTHLRCGVQDWKKDSAKKMLEKPTESETVLWQALKNLEPGVRWRRQNVILGWIVDFYCPSHKVVVEVDGLSHRGREQEDARRDQVMFEQRGLRTIRVSADLVERDVEHVLDIIRDALGMPPGW